MLMSPRRGRVGATQTVLPFDAVEAVISFDAVVVSVTPTPSVAAPSPDARSNQGAAFPTTATTSTTPASPVLRRYDYRIDPAENLPARGSRARVEDNVTAIRLLKRLQADNRLASPDEQSVLARYVGWGASDLASIVGAPEPESTHDQAARAELRALLSEREFLAVRDTILNAHYSYVEVPRAIWQALQHLGFRGGRILEPSVGVGHFLGTMPDDLRSASEVHAVDIEPITAAIAQQLYQTAHVQALGFEAARFSPGYFDLVVGNVPFGKYGVADPMFHSPERVPLARSIHNYFFARALDLVRPGGLVAFITSRYTLDAASPVVRKYLAQQSDFLGAVRLPRTTFALAGTDVVTDFIVLRRRAHNAPDAHVAEWLHTVPQALSPSAQPSLRVPVSVNEYFAAYPTHVLGIPVVDRAQHQRFAYTVNSDDGRPFHEALADRLLALPRDAYRSHPSVTSDTLCPPATAATAKDGEFYIDLDGRVYTTKDAGRRALAVSDTARSRIQRFVALREAYRAVLSAMVERQPLPHICRTQERLRRAYDTFVRAHGLLNTSSNRRALSGDPESARLFALEDIDWIERRRGSPRVPVVRGLADIFTKVTVSTPEPPTQAATSRDALVHSLSWRGMVDLPYMAALCQLSESDLLADLAGTELFRDPITEQWVTRDAFLSGDVLAKLDAARARAVVDATWRPDVGALEAVRPQLLEAEDIDIRLGSAWVPLHVYQDFVAEQLDVTRDDVLVQFVNTETLSKWLFTPAGDTARRRATSHDLNVADRTFFDLLNDAANIARPEVRKRVGPDSDDTIPDPEMTNALRESIRQVDERFRAWWREEPERAASLTDLYNRTFNRTVLRTFDGSHLVLPGSNPEIVLRPHQRAAVWRVLQSGNTLIAHRVGAGKTFTLVAIAMEHRRLGLAHKPLIAVPNHMLEQWRRDILRLYPAAKVLAPSHGDLADNTNRQCFLGRIAAGDWDVVLLTHSAFELIPVSRTTFEQFVEEQVEQLQAYLLETMSAEAKKTAKQIQLAIKRLQDKLAKRTKQWQKDQILTFEELGVDMLCVDEAHLYKNLFFSTKLTRVAGLSQSESDRAIDMFLKVRFLNRRTHSRGVVFATGTPVCNAVSELFTMQRYLAMDQLNGLGLANFDNWKSQFADVIELAEPAPEGGYRTRARLRQYSNLGELIVLFRQFADVLTANDLRLPVPAVKGGRPTIVTADPPPAFETFLESLRTRVEQVRQRRVDPHVDNMLKITSEAAAAAVDMRLIDSSAGDHPTGRLARAAERIAQTYRDTEPAQGTQLVFLDLGVPAPSELLPLNLDDVPVAADTEVDAAPCLDTAEDDNSSMALGVAGRNLYEDLRQKLIQRGVSPAHIAFIHQARTDGDKKRLCEAMNTGRIRILLASSNKGGVGMNVQRRLVALHHLDVPWRPADLEQREGRILRQGNVFYEADSSFEVEITRYVTARSFDEYRWGLLAMKQQFITQLLQGRSGLRTFEDQDTSQLSFEEAAAAASGDPRTAELLALRQQLARLEARYTLHTKRSHKARAMIRQHQHDERFFRNQAERLPAFATALDSWDRQVTLLDGRAFRIDEVAGRAALRSALHQLIREYASAHSHWERLEEIVGNAGSLYAIVLHVPMATLNQHSQTWNQTLSLELSALPAWSDVRCTVSYGGPVWNITSDPSNPPDFVRSFNARWKASTWLLDLAASYAARANEATHAREREEELASRTFSHHTELNTTRARVHELECSLSTRQELTNSSETTCVTYA